MLCIIEDMDVSILEQRDYVAGSHGMCSLHLYMSSNTTSFPPYSIEDIDVNRLEQRGPFCRISYYACSMHSISVLFAKVRYLLLLFYHCNLKLYQVSSGCNSFGLMGQYPFPFLFYLPYVVIRSSFCVPYVISDIVTDRSTGYNLFGHFLRH